MLKKPLLASGLVVSLLSAGSAFADINVLVEGGGLQLQKDMAAKFTEETGIKVNFAEVPYQGVFDKLTAEIASGNSNYDVATIDVVWNAAFADHVEDLSDLFTDEVKNDLPKALLADAKVNGKFIGMPGWANAEIVFYRKDLWEDEKNKADFKQKYGYELAPPKDWQQWRDMAKFFTKDNMYGTSVNGMNSEEWMAHILQAGSPGVMLDDDGKVIVNNEAHKKALDFYIAPLCEDKSVPENALEIGWGEAQNLFYQGKTAMMKFWAHAYKLTPEDSKVQGKVGVVPMLAGEAGIAGIPGPWYNVIPKTAKNKDEAKQFIAYAIKHNALGIEAPLGLAATNSAYKSYNDKKGYEHFGSLLETLGAKATKGRPINKKYQELVDEAFLPALQSALKCDQDTKKILDKAAETMEDILN